ncbi:MAG: RNA methyltransferase [Myxococcales bacterium]|nr:RNA methyltransferase [Polyangiaceae bacterium]MDW8251022.1 RNA methyltransferase [Myxococcales bacterium]
MRHTLPRSQIPPSAPNPKRPPPFPHTPSHAFKEEVTFGFYAGLALLNQRPEDVQTVLFSPEVASKIAGALRRPRERGVPCREAPEQELARSAGSTHHEGLCVVARARRWFTPAELAEHLLQRQGVAVALDRVRNPYNIGAILRTAAFFGLDGVLLGAPAPHPALAPDAIRVAEGGAEHLKLSRTTDLADTLGRLRSKGVAVVGAESHGTVELAGYHFPRPVVVVLGNEREGLGDRIRARCDRLVSIRGSGAVQSLNVSIAAGVMIAEMVRNHPSPGR